MLIILILASISLFIFLTMSSYWGFVFIREIHLNMLYRRGAARNVSDNDDGYLTDQYCYHFQTEIWKYVFLLSINSAEVLGAIFIVIQLSIQTYYTTNIDLIDYSIGDYGNVNNTYLNYLQFIQSSSLAVNTIEAFVNIAEIMVVALGICLMNYLAKRLKKVRILPGALNNKKFLLVTFLISVSIISSAVIRTFLILSRILLLTTLTIYFVIFVQTVKQFKLTLFVRAVQHLTQYGSNKEELKQYKYFSYTSTLITIGLLCFLLGIYLGALTSIYISVFFYSKYFFPFNLFSLNIPVLRPGDMDAIVTALKVVDVIKTISSYTGGFLAIVPFVLVTLYTWCNSVCRAIRNRKKEVYRFSGNYLTDYLINIDSAAQLTEGADCLAWKGLVK